MLIALTVRLWLNPFAMLLPLCIKMAIVCNIFFALSHKKLCSLSAPRHNNCADYQPQINLLLNDQHGKGLAYYYLDLCKIAQLVRSPPPSIA